MPDSPGSVILSVSITAAAAQAFDNAVSFGLPQVAQPLSHCIALTWLSQPPVRILLERACPPGTLPMQVSQFIATTGTLALDTPYTLTATIASRGREQVLSYAARDDAGTLCTHGEIGFLCVDPVTFKPAAL